MKKSFKKIFIIAVLAIVFLMQASFCKADDEIVKTEENVEDEVELISTLDEGETSIIGIMDADAVNGVYKLSDESYNVYLPFVRYAADRIVLDKENITSLGSLFSATSIEVNEKQAGLKCLFAADTVRVNAPMDYAVIFAGENVIIDSKIENSVIIFGGANVTFTENAEVLGDIIVFSPEVQMKGKVQGSLVGFTSNLDVAGTVEKDLRVECDEINVSGSDVVKGNAYIETYNENLNVEKLDNVTVNVLKKEAVVKQSILDQAVKAVIVSLVFTLIYMIVTRKTKVVEETGKLVKNHVLFFILSGSISLLGLPIIVTVLIILCAMNLSFIAVPLLAVYVAFLICSGMLSTLVVGSLIIKYITDKYLEKENKWMKTGFCFLCFVVLYILARIPVIESYVTWGLVILSNGAVLLGIFKRKSLKEDN